MSRQVELEIVGMTGAQSVAQVTQALKNAHGVRKVEVSLAPGRAVLEIEPGVVVEHLLETIEEAGFMARPAEASA